MRLSRRFVIPSVIVLVALSAITYAITRPASIGMKAALSVSGKVIVPVHCRASLADSVAAGKYREVNQYIDDQDFPSYHFACKESQEEMSFVKFDRDMRSDEAIERMRMAGFRPADLRELLAFGEAYPTTHQVSAIVALGSAMREMDLSPYLYGERGGQSIGLHGDGESETLSSGYRWHAGDLFLASRN